MTTGDVPSPESGNFRENLQQFPLNLLTLGAEFGGTSQEEADLRARICHRPERNASKHVAGTSGQVFT
jgi:hypothetical protein